VRLLERRERKAKRVLRGTHWRRGRGGGRGGGKIVRSGEAEEARGHLIRHKYHAAGPAKTQSEKGKVPRGGGSGGEMKQPSQVSRLILYCDRKNEPSINSLEGHEGRKRTESR